MSDLALRALALDLAPLAGADFPFGILLVKATLVLLVALGLTIAMQRAPAGARHLVWLVTLVALLLVPALTAWGPIRVPVLPAAESTSGIASGESGIGALRIAEPEASPAPSGTVTPAQTDSRFPAPGSPVGERAPRTARVELAFSLSSLATLWSLVTAAILLWLAWGAYEVRRIVRGAEPLAGNDWTRPLFEIADRLELENPPRLLRSDDARMPFACGFVTPTIVLPRDCEHWSLDRRRAVLLHELAHVKRRDLAGHTLGRIACALWWFHPLAWTAARRLRAESERACDDMAIACGARASDYAEHLLEIVTSVRHDRTPAVALAMARRKEFEGRMLAILDREPGAASPTRRQSATLIATLGLVSVLIGAASPAPRTPSPEAAQAAIATTDTTLPEADEAPEAPQRTAAPAAPAVPAAPEASVAIADDEAAQATESETDDETKTARPKVAEQAKTTPPDESHDAEHVDAAALTALIQQKGSAGADERATLLAEILANDSSASLRRIAAWGLHEYADRGTGAAAARALAAALRGDADAGVREMAAWALHDAEEGGSVTIDALGHALRNDANAKVRRTAAWALGSIGERSAEPALVAALADTSRDVRVRALWALGTIEPRQAPAAVVAALRDSSAGVRRLAAWALFQIEDPSTAGALNAALQAEKDKNVQMAYIRALAAIGEESVDAIRTLLQSSDPEVRAMAVRALAGGSATGPWPMPWPEPRPHP